MSRALDTQRSTIYTWIRADPLLQQAIDNERESVVDDAESALYRKAFEGDEMNAIFYILNNMAQAKRRGWGPRQELTGADGAPVTIQLNWGDSDTDAND